MEYLVPLLIVLVVVVAVVLGARILRRRGQTAQGAGAPEGRAALRASREVTRENAEAASARLTPEQHRRVYSQIAQRQVLNAVKEYRVATHVKLADAAAAVAALSQFPQPTPAKEAPLTVNDILAPPPNAYRYRAIVSAGDEVREVASTRLNEQIYSEIRSLALSGRHDDAARLLRDHADIGETEAREFVAMIGPED